jgi:hypothetical protein
MANSEENVSAKYYISSFAEKTPSKPMVAGVCGFLPNTLYRVLFARKILCGEYFLVG